MMLALLHGLAENKQPVFLKHCFPVCKYKINMEITHTKKRKKKEEFCRNSIQPFNVTILLFIFTVCLHSSFFHKTFTHSALMEQSSLDRQLLVLYISPSSTSYCKLRPSQTLINLYNVPVRIYIIFSIQRQKLKHREVNDKVIKKTLCRFVCST